MSVMVTLFAETPKWNLGERWFSRSIAIKSPYSQTYRTVTRNEMNLKNSNTTYSGFCFPLTTQQAPVTTYWVVVQSAMPCAIMLLVFMLVGPAITTRHKQPATLTIGASTCKAVPGLRFKVKASQLQLQQEHYGNTVASEKCL